MKPGFACAVLVLAALLPACASSTADHVAASAGGVPPACAAPATEIPDRITRDFSLDPFYRRYLDARGLPVLASRAPSEQALQRACSLVSDMLSGRPDVRLKLIELQARFVVIGQAEGTADIPEYGLRDRPQAEKDAMNARARGLGGQAGSCGEENLLCLAGDRYRGESICVHEFAHTIREGVHQVDPDFSARLQAAFEAASASGKLAGTYRAENADEYWAEGVQDWYGANAEAEPPDGIHNAVNTRDELALHDPRLHALIGEVFPESPGWRHCEAR